MNNMGNRAVKYMKTKKVYIRKIGDWIDDNAFGGHYVDEDYQKRKVEEAKRTWKNTIRCKYTLKSKVVRHSGGTSTLEYYKELNPYYGWKEKQLEIIIR